MPVNNHQHQPLLAQVQTLLGHLDAQERALLAFKSLLTDLGRGEEDESERRRIRQRMEAAADLCARLRNDSTLILQQLAKTLSQPPENVTAKLLASLLQRHSPTVADSLRMSRRRLLRLTWQIQRISGNTAWILSEQQAIRKNVFEFAGGVPDSDRYNARGRKQISPESFRYGARS